MYIYLQNFSPLYVVKAYALLYYIVNFQFKKSNLCKQHNILLSVVIRVVMKLAIFEIKAGIFLVIKIVSYIYMNFSNNNF